ncbi:MAG TPA: GDSL-type esterase/lipase family protein [Mucilaginibacter sp.]|jgi:lysophospholipase L1-like esterase
MKKLQIILIGLIMLAGCVKKVDHLPGSAIKLGSRTNNTPAADTLSYLALGDSYTTGAYVTTPESYPYQLISTLNAQSFQLVNPIEIAKPGWTTDDLISAISASGINNTKFHFVTLLIGVNDEARGLSQSNYKLKFMQLLNTAINFANGNPSHVFVLSIPDWGVMPFANGQDSTIGPQIDSFNDINEAVSQQAGVNYLYVTAISRMAATDPSLIAPDGLHPSGKMYTLWVNLLEPMVAEQLKK